MLKNDKMRFIEAIRRRFAVIPPEKDNNPVGTFLQVVNFGLEQTLGKGSLHQLEQKTLSQRLRSPTCQELDEATREALNKKGITSPFWGRVLVFSSHEECYLPGQSDFVYDQGKGLFELSLKNVLMNAEDIQIVCQHLEELFNKRFAQARFSVQRGKEKPILTEKMFLGVDQINKQERTLFIIARYRNGYPQITLSVLSLGSDWKKLFDDKGKLKVAPPDVPSAVPPMPDLPQFTSPKKEELPTLLAVINDILRKEGLIKSNEQIRPDAVFLPPVVYAPASTAQLPVYVVADQEEIDFSSTLSLTPISSIPPDKPEVRVMLNGLFKRCYRESIAVPYPPKDKIAILLTLNPRVFKRTLDGGFYRSEKGIIAIPFELPNN